MIPKTLWTLDYKWRTIFCYNCSPCVENIILSFIMVLPMVIDFIMWTSIHLEWALTNMRNICPINGPAKSKSSWLKGWVGHIQGATRGGGAWLLTNNISFYHGFNLIIHLGHQTYDLAKAFILFVPGWLSRDSCKTSLWYYVSMTIQESTHSTQPCRTLSSHCLVENGHMSSSSTLAG